jgi:16S rRNA (guanine966-N2)-methyltransferase
LGTLRIIAGSLRGRRIRVPDGPHVRPTSDRVREALFSILGHDLPGASVLDPYAGSGALGFEALSRGVSLVTFLECDRSALEILRANASVLGVEDRCRILHGRAQELIERGVVGGPFDLVLADPPYAAGEASGLLAALARSDLLARGARLVLERDRITPEEAGTAAGWALVRTVRYGRTCLDFYSWEGGAASG